MESGDLIPPSALPMRVMGSLDGEKKGVCSQCGTARGAGDLAQILLVSWVSLAPPLGLSERREPLHW